MELFKLLDVDFKHQDERGELVQLVHQGFSQVNVLKTAKGVQRGGHYHKTVREAFYVVSGSVEVSFQSVQDNIVCKKLFSEGDFFLIPPWVAHSMSFPEFCIMVAMYDKSVVAADGTKDIYSMEVQA